MARNRCARVEIGRSARSWQIEGDYWDTGFAKTGLHHTQTRHRSKLVVVGGIPLFPYYRYPVSPYRSASV